jgi:hypothetical protein
MCGAFRRRCWLASDNAAKSGVNSAKNAAKSGFNAGKNAAKSGFNAGKNASENARARRWSRQTAPVVTPGRAARCGALAVSLLLCLCAGLASANAARCPALFNAPERHLPDAGAFHGVSPHAATLPAALACSAVPRSSGARACSSAKRGDCRNLPGSAWIRRNSPELAQCPSAARFGTVGGMIHATPTTRQQTRRAPALPTRKGLAELSTAVHHRPPCCCKKSPTKPNHAQCPSASGLGTLGSMNHATPITRQRTRRAPTLPTWKGRACTCPNLPNAAQPCPSRPVALTVSASMREMRGILASVAPLQTQRAAPVQKGSQP